MLQLIIERNIILYTVLVGIDIGLLGVVFVFCLETNENAPCRTRFLKNSDATVDKFSFCPTLHFMYPYKFASLRIKAITTSNYK